MFVKYFKLCQGHQGEPEVVEKVVVSGVVGLVGVTGSRPGCVGGLLLHLGSRVRDDRWRRGR